MWAFTIFLVILKQEFGRVFFVCKLARNQQLFNYPGLSFQLTHSPTHKKYLVKNLKCPLGQKRKRGKIFPTLLSKSLIIFVCTFILSNKMSLFGEEYKVNNNNNNNNNSKLIFQTFSLFISFWISFSRRPYIFLSSKPRRVISFVGNWRREVSPREFLFPVYLFTTQRIYCHELCRSVSHTQ